MRKPKRRRIGGAAVFISSAPTAEMQVMVPATNADSPKATCSSMARRKGLAPIPTRMNAPPSTEAEKVAWRKIDRSTAACGVRLACQPKTHKDARPAAKRAAMRTGETPS